MGNDRAQKLADVSKSVKHLLINFELLLNIEILYTKLLVDTTIMSNLLTSAKLSLFSIDKFSKYF